MQHFNFDLLTPDFMWQALLSIGIRAESGMLALNSYENRVYQFSDEQQQRWVVKFYRPQRWSEQQLLEEHQLALELVEAEVPVVAPSIINGKTLHTYQGHFFALYPSVGGRQFEVDNLDQLEGLGRYLGRLHQVSLSAQFTHRPQLSLQEFAYQSREQLHNSQAIPAHLESAFFNDLDLLIEGIEQQWFEAEYQGRLHGDCHPGNILWRDDAPIIVDLDDSRNGPAIQDIWMLLSGDRSERIVQLDTVLQEYQQYCEFDPSELKLIEPLRGLRLIHYMAWLSKRWQDPAFPLAFPWFGDDKYWEGQVLAFKEQIALLNEPPLTLTPHW